MEDMINHVVHVVNHNFQAAERGEAYDILPELTEEEQLAVAILISQEEERSVFLGFEDALALTVVPPPPPGPPPMQPPCTPPVRQRREARGEPWDAWPGATLAWSACTPPILG
jgi:hypothetical protein